MCVTRLKRGGGLNGLGITVDGDLRGLRPPLKTGATRLKRACVPIHQRNKHAAHAASVALRVPLPKLKLGDPTAFNFYNLVLFTIDTPNRIVPLSRFLAVAFEQEDASVFQQSLKTFLETRHNLPGCNLTRSTSHSSPWSAWTDKRSSRRTSRCA